MGLAAGGHDGLGQGRVLAEDVEPGVGPEQDAHPELV